jgi:hypothetical protein
VWAIAGLPISVCHLGRHVAKNRSNAQFAYPQSGGRLPNASDQRSSEAVTHEVLATVLGVRRSGVTVACRIWSAPAASRTSAA